jgi:serine/threonine-protein kinase HipA
MAMSSLVVNRAATMGIYLQTAPDRSLRVGTLLRDPTGGTSFVVDESYISMGPDRPVVSMAWQGPDEEKTIARLVDRKGKFMQSGLLPPFFQNLLPEGALRELVDREFGVGRFDEFDVLARLGSDLPGAIVARVESGTAGGISPDPRPRIPIGISPGNIKFSLAGVQLKFSVLKTDKGVTVPGRDIHGGVILKVPTAQYPLLPEAEYTGLELARLAGVNAAESWLVDIANVEGIPSEYLSIGQTALAVRRFDRPANGRRIHIEDFAQILEAVGDQKYTLANDETNLNMIRRFTGDWSGNLLEGVRRVIVNLMLGNGDAHLKNWSFIYKQGEPISLSPAYDIVPTILYGDMTMALPFGGTKDATRITLKKFERATGLVKVPVGMLVKEARLTVERILDTWPDKLKEFPVTEKMRSAIVNRWADMAIVHETRPTFVAQF